MRGFALAVAAALALAGCAQNGAAWQPVTEQRLVHADKDDGWLMYLRTYDAQGHVPYTEINTTNVGQLHEVFTHPVNLTEGFEAPPIVNGRTMIVTTPLDHVYALDAVTGKQLWSFDWPLQKAGLRTVCCDVVNRGVALYGNRAYLATLDNHILALDARTGHLDWDKAINPPGIGYTMTGAPLIVHGLVIQGDGGGEFGSRGFIVALDAQTGAEKWRFYTIPSPDQPGGDTWPGNTYLHGGGDPWMTGSYDTQSNTLYYGVGNPGPWLSSERKGRNLYTDSIVALDPDTGKLKFYFQQTPNDSWDYDATSTPPLVDVTVNGKLRKTFLSGARNGWFYLVDRTNGHPILEHPFTMATSVTGYDDAHQIGTVNAALKPVSGKSVFTCPAFFGGDNWWSYTYDPQTHMAYVPTMHTCMKLTGTKPHKFKAGINYVDEEFSVEPMPGAYGWGALTAIDVTTGKKVWSKETKMPWNDGTMSTDGGLVFSGTPDQKFYAFDARTGKVLWEHHMSSGVIGQPVSYRVDGKQYIAVQAGFGGVAPFYGGKKMTPIFKHIHLGGRLYVFSL
ncbi:MAG TPA: PQQ-dependent dehydrogenase, methanol/ethanol family [Candidatus Baltobacteraceae bacterium]